jgi:taurine dioxygenase
MAGIEVRDLREDLPFGAIVTGATFATLADPAIRRQINQLFEDRGMIVFDGVEPSEAMHAAISDVFGPLKDHPVPSVARVDQNKMPGVIDMKTEPESCGLVEIDGRRMTSWSPWHFDHCYNGELNRAGVLRAIEIPPEGGLTGFADGIEMYRSLSEETREKIAGLNVVYTLNTMFSEMRFGLPKGFREVRTTQASIDATAHGKTMPRALHPMVWTRKTGEKVLHVSPFMAAGIHGHEDSEGDRLLEEVCQEMIAKITAYHHQWKPDQMLIWDNWRMLHSVGGMDPKYSRRMQRTTILGDYGLGSFEAADKDAARLENA